MSWRQVSYQEMRRLSARTVSSRNSQRRVLSARVRDLAHLAEIMKRRVSVSLRRPAGKPGLALRQ